jgi:hypothetical protein
MKYLILQMDVGALVCKFPFIFPSELTHVEVMEAMKTISKISSCEVVSAGQCHIHYLYCYGVSKTLGVPFKPIDNLAIVRNDFLRCMTLKEIEKTPQSILKKIENSALNIIDHHNNGLLTE